MSEHSEWKRDRKTQSENLLYIDHVIKKKSDFEEKKQKYKKNSSEIKRKEFSSVWSKLIVLSKMDEENRIVI